MENRMEVLFMLMIQAGTLLSATLFFQRIFEEEKTKLATYFGILLYMTCPYRIYVCYDLADLSQAVAWMLLPLYAWAMSGVVLQKRTVKDMAIAALALAGIGYADVIYFLIIFAITLLAGILLRMPWLFAPIAAGCAIFLPGLYRLLQCLFTDHYQELDVPLHSIMDNGYRFGEYFHSFAYRDGHPGMGLGMMIGLLSGLWLSFVQGKKNENRTCKFFGILSIGLLALSFYRFPWDILQRLGAWSLKLISIINTPAVFAGIAFASLSVPAAWGVHRISKHENKVIAYAIPTIVLIACIGLCFYKL